MILAVLKVEIGPYLPLKRTKSDFQPSHRILSDHDFFFSPSRQGLKAKLRLGKIPHLKIFSSASCSDLDSAAHARAKSPRPPSSHSAYASNSACASNNALAASAPALEVSEAKARLLSPPAPKVHAIPNEYASRLPPPVRRALEPRREVKGDQLLSIIIHPKAAEAEEEGLVVAGVSGNETEDASLFRKSSQCSRCHSSYSVNSSGRVPSEEDESSFC